MRSAALQILQILPRSSSIAPSPGAVVVPASSVAIPILAATAFATEAVATVATVALANRARVTTSRPAVVAPAGWWATAVVPALAATLAAAAIRGAAIVAIPRSGIATGWTI